MTEGPFTVAIDGTAAAGKGTLAREIARSFGFAHLDTGLLYRATGVKAAEGLGPVAAAQSLTPEDLSRPDLRSGEAGKAASRVAALPEVRAALLAFQKQFARRPGGAVLDGRDIGTVICPEAEVKFFVTASDRVRAERRNAELTAAGEDTTLEAVLAALQSRDAADAARDTAPMRPAGDAVLLDTTEMSVEAAVAAAKAQIEAALRARG
ncbi:MAG: (d)CMP kinase [Pseudomonadota bacterium]